MIAEHLYPHIGGVERHVDGLTRILEARGHQVTLAAPKHDPSLPDEEERNGVRVIWLPRTGRQRRDYVRAWGWWMRHRSFLTEADLIHFHDVYTLLHWFGPAHLLCWGKPLYLTYHGCERRYPPLAKVRLYYRLAARLTRGSLCVGHYLLNWFGLHPMEVTYGAVTAPSPVPALPDTPRAVFVGRLAANTSPDIYLQALGRLQRETGLSLSLTVCGDGPLRPVMETMACEEGVDATFLGFVADPTQYLARGTIAFASSFLAILEAMAMRRPVFSTYHNPVKESYLRDIPSAEEMMYITGSPAKLADQLANHIRCPDHAAAMVDRAAAFAVQHTWERLADSYLQLWSKNVDETTKHEA